MDLAFGSPAREPLVTNVGLITSNGPWGHNIMAAEWTYQISYKPALIAISIGPNKATHENISETKCFGVSIASEDQTVASSIAGSYKGREIDKIAALKEMSVSFSKAKNIDVLLVDGAALLLECKVIDQKIQGDHTVFVGEALSVIHNPEQSPLLYHRGKFWSIGEERPKPSDEKRSEMKEIVEKHRK